MTVKSDSDKNSMFVGVIFILIASIVGTGGILWRNFVEYTSNVSDLQDVFSGVANQASFVLNDPAHDRSEIVFTFTIPRGDLVQFIEIVQPTLDHIVSPTGRKARIDISSNELEVINKIERQIADFGSISTTGYATYKSSHSIRAVLERFSDPPKRPLFIVRSADPAGSLDDLSNYRVAIKTTDSIIGYHLPLRKVKGDSFRPEHFFRQEFYSENYSDMVLGLHNNNYDCIILASNYFFEQPETVRETMKVVFEGDPLPGGVYIANSTTRMPFEQIIAGNFMKVSAAIDTNAMFAGMFRVRAPDDQQFEKLETELLK